ncbi:MAG TPA: P-loop NTPase fold protein [Longimicrobium sp.]|uniref:P-loop NTPase fold protein n=1 Tax=Longimicrobium sp. TaxID=2029185 RepID=UPI002EDADD5E
MEIAHDVVPRGDTQTRYTAMRHLLAATVTYEPAQRGLAEHLGQLGISVQAFRSRLLSVLRQAGSGENVAVWLELLAAAPAAIGLHKEAPAAFMDRDAPTGHDKLSITAEVNALAAVLASRQLKPPLSVGLFGDWGTGKSFFMRRMFLRIRKHASDAEQKVPGSEAFHSRIVQITFNAWHYMDANLWASLVTGVFDGLAEHLKGKEQSVAHMREQLLSRLAADHSVLRDAERRKVAAEDATRRARDQMEQVRAQSAGLRSVLRASPDVLRAAVDHPAVTGKLAQLAESYGIPSSVVVERAWADRLNTRMDRVRALLQVMSGKGGDRRRLLITGLFTLAILAAAYVAWRAAGWAQDSGAVRSLAAAGAAVSALGIQWAGYLRPLSMKIRKAAAEARQIRGKAGELAAQVMEDEEKPRSEARRRLQHLEAEEQAAVEAHDAAVRQVHKAQEELEEIQAGRRLHRFIAERSATADYRRHLGIVALIRNDFERLSTLLQEAGTSADGEVPAVERIILYIDDLDRCPEQRVVEVLQAVHLLLAFPLFVVVVGVDSRWLLRSVRSHYSELLSGGDEPRGGRGAQGEEDENDWASTPQNYLEKIFQIPFTLRPMNSDGYASLIQGLIPMEGDPEEEAGDDGEGLDLYRPTSPVIPRVAVAASPEAITSISPVAQESTATRREAQESPVITEEGSTAGPVRTAVGPPRELVSVGTRTRIVGPDKQAGDAEGGQRAAMATGESPLGDSTADAAEGLQITSDEREFLQRLSPLIPSPRSAKRLVNVYRFIRGSLSPDERDRFLGAGGTVPEYPAVALLLGVVTGFPTQAVTLFQALIENDAAGTSTWWDFCNGLEAPPEDPRCWAKFRAALAELERARTPLLADTALDPFVRWAPYVSRFSFQTGNLFARRHG